LEPTNTRPPAIADDESTRARVVNVQSGLPVFTSSACTIFVAPAEHQLAVGDRRRRVERELTVCRRVFPEQLLALQIERHHFVVEGFAERRRERSCTQSEQPVRSMEWVGDFSRLKSTTWRWWT
jgi:hypothetical protein